MTPINSYNLLNDLKSKSIHFLNQLTGLLEKTPVESLGRKFPDGRWNVLQILEHLNSYNRYYLPRLEQKIESGNRSKSETFKPGWLGSYFTKMMLPKEDGTVKKMKAFKNHIPDSKLDYKKVTEEFLAGQRKLVKLIDLAVSTSLNGNRIPITLSPLITLQLGDVLSFIVAHNERHRLQIERTL